MKSEETFYQTTTGREYEEKHMIEQKSKQAGIAFPTHTKQENLLIVRLNVLPINLNVISNGLKRLCTFFENIDSGVIKTNELIEDTIVMSPLSVFNFSATIGFGRSFFQKLGLMNKCPKKLIDMPNYSTAGDFSRYSLSQTDIIIQICSSKYSLNKMILQNDSYLFYDNDYLERNSTKLSNSNLLILDILEGINEWAKITDLHVGFLRTDGRNIKGFYDGISNPDRIKNDVIWTTSNKDMNEPADATYMVFNKIEHNLEEWYKLDLPTHEKLIGRSKATGLLLGSLSPDIEQRLVADLRSSNEEKRNQALKRWMQILNHQKNPKENFFNPYDLRYRNINRDCPTSSHVRTANPRQPNNQRLIFRRGYLYMEGIYQNLRSGLLFISFQKDIKETFESIKKKPITNNYASNFTNEKYDENELKDKTIIKESFNNTNLGGGYYYIPPIPFKKISEIGQEFFR
ncbi:MAG TPA: Dyp-type peroxidase [Nitrososphaeraceae archaeon]|nr:Dyp-type peroxidase [Nitrososphaeraceae archaeon]